MIHSFDTNIAKEFGITCAVILNNFYYWIEKNKANNQNYFDGNYWTYNSNKALTILFPYLTEKQISYAIDKLVEAGILIKGNYNKYKFDRTLWYAISEEGMEILEKTKKEKDNDKEPKIDERKLGNDISQNCKMHGENCKMTFPKIGEPIPNSKPDKKLSNSKPDFSLKEKLPKEKKEKEQCEKEQLKEKMRPIKQYLVDNISDEDIKNKIYEIFNNRIQRGKTISLEFTKLFLEKLEKYSGGNYDTKIQILNKSIMGGYDTIYELPNNGNQVKNYNNKSSGNMTYNSKGNYSDHIPSYNAEKFEEEYDLMKEVGYLLDDKPNESPNKEDNSRILKLKLDKETYEEELKNTTSYIRKYDLQLKIQQIDSELNSL